MKKEKVSLIMVVKGRPHHIFEAIKSAVSIIAEIILIDIGCDKDLRERLKMEKFGVPLRFVEAGKPVPYVELIREETKTQAKYDYILFLDEDEELSSELIEVLSNNLGKYDYFATPRKNIIFNKWIQNSRWWPDYQVRLFRKSHVSWPKIIHSQPRLTGNGFSFGQEERFAIIHHNYDSIDEYLSKGVRYAKAQAKERIKENKKYSIIDAFNEGLSEFIGRFFANAGYKDGLHGLVLATLQMFHAFLVYCYYLEDKKFDDSDSPDPVLAAKHLFENGTYQVHHWLNKEKLLSPISVVKSKIVNKLLK